MSCFEELTITLPDGYEAYGRYYAAANPRGAVLYHHGIQSHCGWYEESAASLAEAGFAVLQVDRRGCGRNATDRGHAESAQQLVGDSLAARDVLRSRSALARHHLVGVSWGGRLIVASYVADPNDVASLSLVTPGLFPLAGVSKERASEIGFSMLYEQRKFYDIPLNAADLFSADARWQKFFDTDPNTLRQATAGFYLASRWMDKMFTKLSACAPIPVHLMLAGDERIIDNDKTRSFVDDLGWPSVRISTYPESRHSLEFEPERERYFSDLITFIAQAG